MQTNLFQLKVIQIKNILGHEELDPSNSKELVRFLKKTKTFSNPIVVAPLGDNKYLQLDGMNRIYSFKMMGIKTITAQIVDYNNQEEIRLSSWLHIFNGDLEKFIAFIKKNNFLFISQGKIDQVGHRYIKEKDFGRLCTVVTNKGEVFFISTGGNFLEKIKRMNYLVSFYKNNLSRGTLPYTLNGDTIKKFFKQYSDENIIVIFPTFTPQQIIESSKSKVLLPTGITRHLIKGRVINVNLPMSLFDNKKSLKEQNGEQDKILLKKRSRLYEEATVSFE